MKTVKLTINGIETEALERTPVLQVAGKHGINIPTLCHHPILEPYGSCRICIVEVKIRNRTRLVTACNYPVTEGIRIQTDSERVRRNRKMILEWLLARCGNVKILNDLAAEYGITEPRFGRGDDNCILCGLCTRVCSDIVGCHVLSFFNRGPNRYVSTPYDRTSEDCIACGACAYVCPTDCIQIENEEALIRKILPLGPRTPIQIPFMQAVPNKPVIDESSCIHFKTGECKVCEQVCEPKAINHKQEDRIEEVKAGTVLLATGFKTFDAARIPEYGYGHYDNVFTSLDMERMLNASGPTGGKVFLKNGQPPERVAIIHCVGSRHDKYNTYCSKVCCMYSLKLAHLVEERSGAEIYNFYIDMRTPGKGYEEFYDRLKEEGTHFIRGRVAEVTDWAYTDEEKGKLVIRAEDTMIGVVRRVPVDMVILAVGLEPQPDAEDVRRLFNISCSHEGWFLEQHPKLAPVSTFTDGIFLAGTCQGPKDIPETVAQAGAAASQALALIDKGYVTMEPNTAWIDEDNCSGCKTCIPLCPYSAIEYDQESRISKTNEALCKGCGTCVAACPTGSAQQHLYMDDLIFEEIKGVLNYV